MRNPITETSDNRGQLAWKVGNTAFTDLHVWQHVQFHANITSSTLSWGYDTLRIRPLHHPYAYEFTYMQWNLAVNMTTLLNASVSWSHGQMCANVTDSQFTFLCLCVCVCACVCMCVIMEVSSTVCNGCDPLKLHCHPLQFQQPSSHAKSDSLNHKV